MKKKKNAMRNIHIYPSAFTHESRILRESAAIERMKIFSTIELVGVQADSLPHIEQIGETVFIRRLGPQKGTSGVAKLVLHLLWCINVLWYGLKSNPRCVNCHSLTVLPLGVIIKFFCRSKLVYDAHELETETNGLKGLRKKISKFIEKSLIGACDYSIFVGDAIKKWYECTYGPIKSDVIYNSPEKIDIEKVEYVNLFRDKFNISKNTNIFLYLGILSPGRGIELLLETFENFPGEAIVFMGYGPLEVRVADAAAKSDGIFFHHAVPPRDVLRFVAAADYGVSLIEPSALSYEYAMPNKLFEYIMAGKPVLVSPTMEQKLFVERYRVGVVARSLTYPGLREAVSTLAESAPHQYARGLAEARERFDWGTQEAILKRIFLDDLGFGSSKERQTK